MFLVSSFLNSERCYGQLDKLKSKGANYAPDLLNKAPNKTSIADRITDFDKVKSEYEHINNRLNNFLEIASDSSFQQYNKDSIRVLLKNQLDTQQKFLDGLSGNIDNSGDGNFVHPQIFEQAKMGLESDFTKEDLNGFLNGTQASFNSAFKEKMSTLSEELQIGNLSSNKLIHENGESHTSFFENFEGSAAYFEETTKESKEAVLSRINRKVGFENIEFKEVIVQAKPTLKSTPEKERIKLGFMYNLNDGISISSLIQGSISYRILPNFYSLLGVSYRGGNPKKPHVLRKGYGGNFGLRKYIFSNWYVQGLYERNYLEFIPDSKRNDLEYIGFVNEFNLSAGKEITLFSKVNSTVQMDWNPLFRNRKSLQGSAFLIKMGFTFNTN